MEILMSAVVTLVISILTTVLITGIFVHKFDLGQEALNLQKQQKANLQQREYLENKIQKLSADLLNRQENIRIITKTIIKEVPKVITDEVDNKYPISNGFVRLHDSAATNLSVPKDSSEPDGNPSEVKESEAINTIIDNYESCSLTREKLVALQEIIKEFQK